MNCFQLINTVLDEIYHNEISIADENIKDEQIHDRLLYLYKRFGRLAYTNEPVDYGDPVTRFAYIFKYVPFHANIIYNVINRSRIIQRLFDEDKVKVTCIGGGPGSDLLGILKYLLNTGKRPILNVSLFDREEKWGESWEDVGEKLDPNFVLHTQFQRFDVTDPDTWMSKSKYLDSDLFTMMYFVSEVYSSRERAINFFNHFFLQLPDGALFLYVDNNSPVFTNWLEKLTNDKDLSLLLQDRETMGLEDSEEDKNDLGIYYQKFGNLDKCRPKLTANIDFRVFQKIAK